MAQSEGLLPCFPNIGQKFNGDVNNKVMRDVYAQGFEDKKCTCCQKSKLDDGKCRYEGFCQRSSLVYELVCTTTGKSYIGKTQRNLRKRTQEHVDTVWKQIEWENRVKKGKIDPKKPKKFSVTDFPNISPNTAVTAKTVTK